MKISNSTTNYINQAYSHLKPNAGAPAASRLEKTHSEAAGDSINLSERTKELQKIEKALEIEPGARKEMVARLKESIQQGQYTVDAEKIASKMAGSLLNDIF